MSVMIFIILFVLFFVFTLNSPQRKGEIGESRVASQLYRLNDKEYKVINNILIKNGNRSSQIDHIVISIYGIYVIETKNYKGWIHGNENAEYWTQSIYNYKSKFRNPIKQNLAHIRAIKQVLSYCKQLTYYSIIVFAGSAKLKNIHTTTPVIYHWELVQTIENKRGMPILSLEQVDNIVEKLNEATIQDKQALKEHIQRVKNQAYEQQQKEQALICPRCGGDLVVKVGQYGKFYGCSSYPKCRYTLPYRA